jgi:hypothetical protein
VKIYKWSSDWKNVQLLECPWKVVNCIWNTMEDEITVLDSVKTEDCLINTAVLGSSFIMRKEVPQENLHIS